MTQSKTKSSAAQNVSYQGWLKVLSHSSDLSVAECVSLAKHLGSMRIVSVDRSLDQQGNCYAVSLQLTRSDLID